MMNKLGILLRVQIKDGFSRYREQMGMKGKRLSKILALLPLFALFPLVTLIHLIHRAFYLAGMPELTLTYVYLATALFAFVFAIPLIISVFFYSRDLALLASLPIQSRTILYSKLASVYLYLLAIAGILMGSGLVFYLIDTGFPLLGLFLGVLGILLAPVLPMILAVLVVLPFMSLAGRKKNRNLLIVLGNLLFLGIILGVQIVFSNAMMNPEEIIGLLSREDGLLHLIGRGFPPSIWLTKMLMGSLQDLLYFLGLNAFSMLLLHGLSGRIYEKTSLLYNQQNQGGGKGRIDYHKKGRMPMLIRRQLGIIFSNPTFMLNAVMTLFVPVLLFVMYSFMGIMSIETLRNPALLPFRAYIFGGIVLSPAIIGSLGATAISREGGSFWETRVLPITTLDNLKSRLYAAHILNGAGQLLLGIGALILLPIPPLDLLVVLFTVISGSLAMANVDLLINIERPFLHWTNPTAAVKNNLNVMLSLSSRVVLLLPAWGLYTLLPQSNPLLLLFFLGLFFTGIFLISWILLKGPFSRKFENIDLAS